MNSPLNLQHTSYPLYTRDRCENAYTQTPVVLLQWLWWQSSHYAIFHTTNTTHQRKSDHHLHHKVQLDSLKYFWQGRTHRYTWQQKTTSFLTLCKRGFYLFFFLFPPFLNFLVLWSSSRTTSSVAILTLLFLEGKGKSSLAARQKKSFFSVFHHINHKEWHPN